jgi:outer membrane protein, heavy metal efflux system
MKRIRKFSISCMQRTSFAILVLLLISLAPGYAQSDTLPLPLAAAEARFTQNNLLLLAQKFSIEESKAFALQAKLWDNPSLYLEQSTYNRTTGEVLPAKGPNGQNIVQVQQLFSLAGKRNKRVGLENINTQIAEYQFFDLLRTLKYELRTSFFEVYFLQQSLTVYDTEIRSLQRTVDLYQAQYERGNIPLKELIRLKAFLFTLENERKELHYRIAGNQTKLQVLMGEQESVYIVPQISREAAGQVSIGLYSLSQLTELALENRYDLKAYQAGNQYARQNLAYQKALAVPDVHLGGVYDRNGSYIANYTGISVGFDLPVFNRNQGNIKAAQARLQAAQTMAENHSLQVSKEVQLAYAKAQEAENLYRKFDKQFAGDFDKLMEGMTRSYERKTIALLEFIDFFESYKENVLYMNQLQTDRIHSLEELSLTTGKTLFSYE